MDIKKIILCIFCSCLLFGCSTESKSKKDVVYLHTYTPEHTSKKTVIELLDENLKTIQQETIKTVSDISYTYYINGRLYLYGPGGLYEFSITNRVPKKITDKDVSNIAITPKGILYTENGGFKKNNRYQSNVYLNNKFLFSVDYAANHVNFKDDKIYITNIPHTENNDEYFYSVYEMNGTLLKMEKQSGLGMIQEINKKVYYVTSYGYLDMEHNEYKKFSIPLDTSYPIVDDKKGMHILDYDYTSNTCKFIDESNGNVKWIQECDGYDYSGNGQYFIKNKDEYILFRATNENEVKIILSSKGKAQEHLFIVK